MRPDLAASASVAQPLQGPRGPRPRCEVVVTGIRPVVRGTVAGMTSSTAPAAAVPTWAEAVRDALAIMAVDGLDVDAEGRELLDAVAREELTPDEAVGKILARYR